MIKKLMKDKIALITLLIILLTMILGIFADIIAPNDPIATSIINKYAQRSQAFPLGTDHLGRCILSRLIYGIRPTLFLSMFTMLCTIALGTSIGAIAGYARGMVDEVMMRIVDIMLSFPSQVMILAVVGMMGVGIRNVIIASIAIKWAWYARMIRSSVIQYNNKNYILYSKTIGTSKSFIVFRHMLLNILSEIIVLATLDMGWVILSISTLSFLGLGVQAPTPEWGGMLSEAKNVITSRPTQMLAPGIAILVIVASFNMLGDSLRDVLDTKEG
ncbi:ABC-type dipeptide/oligopeptide/nickel transport system, permease component [Clostridium aceticum]|uniref:ABC-type dipeptide/oligopeptide/nickel transport system, permease component n=1 Tax=Clostridium aceticum TaxID=84022 RepID=A0A0D8IDE0_9CLOT|nr:nickel/cobalt ABC transporter permease [Clostridium aceticum]AKL95258.1 ABC-type dipeptide/oligopeptide/nickel transport system, permease component [Clostridium aceticum]KJF28109.1 peptide ABC transporter permease [Clostridium aceticum]